jgi:predicted site-specific integrase-resolvase
MSKDFRDRSRELQPRAIDQIVLPRAVGTIGVGAVAEALGVNVRTVSRWAAENVVPARFTAAGYARFPESVVPALLELSRRGVPLTAKRIKEYRDEIDERVAESAAIAIDRAT